MSTYRFTGVSPVKFAVLAGFGVLFCVCFFVQAALAVCTPAYSGDTFRKVYRSNKIFFEGLADIDNDGKPDAYGYELQSNNTFRNVVYVLNNGSGGFGDPVIVNTSFTIGTARGNYYDHTYNSVTPGDVNNDGKLDFVVRSLVGSGQHPKYYTLLSGPGGSYTESASTQVADDEQIVAIADMNGDGRGDLVLNIVRFSSPTSTVNQIYIRLANTDGTFGQNQVLGGLRELISPVVGDLNADGKPDVAYAYWGLLSGEGSSAYHLRVFINQGNATFVEKPVVSSVNATLSGIADVNGDGKKDIVGATTLINDGTGVFTKTSFPASPSVEFPTDFLANPRSNKSYNSDYDGDGDVDIVRNVSSKNGSSYIVKALEVYLNDGANNFTKTVFKRPLLGIPADINGNGKDEEVVFVNSMLPRNTSLNSQLPWASATNEAAIVIRENTCTAPAVRGQTKLVDFDGDRISDLGLWKAGSGQWHVIGNTEERTLTWGGGAFGDIPIPGDYDGDGKTDVAVFREPAGDWWILKSSDGFVFAAHWGATGDIPIPGDYNGDGKSDIAVFRPSDGNWYIWYSGTGGFNFLHFGAAGDIPIPGDFDGDGADNITVFRPSSGDWFYLTSTFDNYVGLHWGATGDIPIPGDYDMDGKDDIAVFRPAGHQWFIFRSSDSGIGAFHFDAGLDTDVPMVADTDGDGVIEPVIYQGRSSGSWWFAVNQPALFWGAYGTDTEKAIRLHLPN